MLLKDTLEKLKRDGSKLISLKVPWQKVEDDDCKVIAEELKKNSVVERVQLFQNNIGSKGCKFIAEALEKSTTLKKLILHNNRIGSEGCAALSKLLKASSTLKELDLSHNCIGNNGCKLIADGIKENASLKALYLRRNEFYDLGCDALLEAFEKNYTITKIDIFSWDESYITRYWQEMKKNNEITKKLEDPECCPNVSEEAREKMERLGVGEYKLVKVARKRKRDE